MTDMTRRSAIGGLALTAAAAATQANAQGAAPAAPVLVPAFAGKHQPRPLRIDPARLTGLSEKLIRSHWENNYQGSVRALNMIENRLAAAMADKDFPPVAYSGLKREQLHRTGSVVLHEHYFDQFGGNGQAAGAIKDALGLSHGSFGNWEAEFRRTAMALAGGSGWAILAYNHHMGALHNYWAWDHTNGPVMSTPLLVLDMYEHAFHMDYGAAAAKYVDAFMQNIDWAIVDARFRAAVGQAA
jgi:superoxide dismutase, Fe-Mn family